MSDLAARLRAASTHALMDGSRQLVLEAAQEIERKSCWIPVSERLPEEGERVLFCNADDEHKYAIMVRVGRCIDDGPTGTRELRIVDFASPTVTATHWMPLPEPPETTK